MVIELDLFTKNHEGLTGTYGKCQSWGLEMACRGVLQPRYFRRILKNTKKIYQLVGKSLTGHLEE